MVYCCVPFCSSHHKTKTIRSLGITFHQFPSQEPVRNKWITTVSRREVNTNSLWTPSDRSVVCSNHFTKDDYKANAKIRCLKPTAIPSIFPDYSAHKVRLGSKRKAPKERSPLLEMPEKPTDQIDVLCYLPTSAFNEEQSRIEDKPTPNYSLSKNRRKLSCCAAPCCKNNRKTHPELSYFQFPKDPKRCISWINNSGLKKLEEYSVEHYYQNYRLCSVHFDAQMFASSLKNRLKGTAVPTLFGTLSQTSSPAVGNIACHSTTFKPQELEVYSNDNSSVSEAMDFSTEEILPDIKPDISTLGILEPSVDESLQKDNKNFVKALTIDSGKCASVSSIANPEESTVEPCEDIKPIIIRVVGSINETTEHIRSTTTDSAMTSDDAIPVNLPVSVSETQEDSEPSSMPLLNTNIFEKVNDLIVNSSMTTNESCQILLESARRSVGCTGTIDVPPVVEDSNKHLHVSVSSKNTPPSLGTAIPIVNTQSQPKLDIDILREMKQANDAFQQKANEFMAKQIRLMEKQIENQNIIIQLLKQQTNGPKFSHL